MTDPISWACLGPSGHLLLSTEEKMQGGGGNHGRRPQSTPSCRSKGQPAGGSSPGWALCLVARHQAAGELAPPSISQLGRGPWMLWLSARQPGHDLVSPQVVAAAISPRPSHGGWQPLAAGCFIGRQAWPQRLFFEAYRITYSPLTKKKKTQWGYGRKKIIKKKYIKPIPSKIGCTIFDLIKIKKTNQN